MKTGPIRCDTMRWVNCRMSRSFCCYVSLFVGAWRQLMSLWHHNRVCSWRKMMSRAPLICVWSRQLRPRDLFAGDLIPRHMKVFKNNEFFAGLSIPEPEVRESIEAKMPRDFSNEGMDFLKVAFQIFSLYYYYTSTIEKKAKQKQTKRNWADFIVVPLLHQTRSPRIIQSTHHSNDHDMKYQVQSVQMQIKSDRLFGFLSFFNALVHLETQDRFWLAADDNGWLQSIVELTVRYENDACIEMPGQGPVKEIHLRPVTATSLLCQLQFPSARLGNGGVRTSPEIAIALAGINTSTFFHSSKMHSVSIKRANTRHNSMTLFACLNLDNNKKLDKKINQSFKVRINKYS